MDNYFTKEELLKSFHTNIDLIIPHLYIGNLFASKDLKLLREKNITHIINCCYGEKPKFPNVYILFKITKLGI